MSLSYLLENLFINQKRIYNFILSFILAILIVLPNYAFAACSPYIGQATLNEFFKDQSNQSNDPDDFAEIKILNDSIPLSTYGNWTIKVCEQSTAASNNDEDGCSTNLLLNTFTDTSTPWIVLKGAGLATQVGQHINLKTGFDATLLDGNGDLIDYITVDSYAEAINGIGCPLTSLVYDYTASSPGASDKTIFRSPDGTGNWDSAPSATAPATEDTSNETLPTPPAGESYPFVTINNVSLSTPGTASFTVSLVDSAGNPTTFSQVITISYYTQDGTATVADTDYTAVPIATPSTITIAAGQSSTTLTVDSPSSTDADAGEYFYAVLKAVQNSADNGGNPNAIISQHYGTATLNGPVAEWNFDICTISAAFDIKDTSGNNLHASPANGIATSAGKICTALSLDGSNDYAEVADNASLDMTEKFTVMAWIRPDTLPGSGLMTILSKDENYEFHINSAGRINWWWNNSSGATREFNSTATISTNVWTHVAIVYEQGSQRIVINGVESGSTSYTETLRTNSDPLHIGGDQLYAGRYFDGLIDEVKVYRRALSTSEINSYYTNPNPTNRTCPTCSAASCNTFRDEFSTQSYSQQNGTVNWATNWIETGDNNNASNGDIQISSGELQLEGDGASPSIEREADLSGYDSATLTFDYRTSGNWEASDNVTVYISNNGGTSWTLQNTISNDQASNTSTVTLAASFLTSNFRIRFVEGSNRWNEIFHIDNVQINACSNSALHHIKITHDGTALTCEPESITVTACANASCTTPHYANDVSVTLTPTGWVGGDTKIISGGSSVFQLRDSTAGITTLSVSASSPATSSLPSPSVTCLNSTANSTSCDLTYYDSGFIFRNDTDSVSATTSNTTIPVQLSGKPSDTGYNAKTLSLRAVQKSATDPTQCAPAFQNKTLNIDFAAECINPSTCISGQLFNLTSGAITGNLTATTDNNSTVGTSSSYDTRSIAFDAAGKANIIFNYPEAGVIELHARHNILQADGTTPSGNYMTGSSTFVVRPFAFYTTIPSNAAATTAAGAAFTSAGTNFAVNVQAVVWQQIDDDGNPNGTPNDGIADGHELADTDPSNNTSLADNAITKNYGQEISIEQVILNSLLHLPSPGNDPSINDTSANGRLITSFDVTTGAGSTSTINYPEVGIIEIRSTVNDLDYLGIGATETVKLLGKSSYVGRFYPHHFDTEVTQGCNTFTYSGQPFRVKAIAKNNLAAPTTTLNYNGDFARDTEVSDAITGTTTFFSNNSIKGGVFASGGQFINGEGQTSLMTSTTIPLPIKYTFSTKDTPPVNLTLRARDTDTTTATGINEASMQIRSGRLRLENVFGPELAPLIMPASTEYYSDNGTSATTTDDGFILNTDDTCTTFDVTAAALTNFTGNLSSGETTLTSTGIISAGEGNITFSAPGVSNEGSVNLLLNNISSPSWLNYSWNIDCDNADVDNDITTGIDAGLCGPFGAASFGLYRGDDRIIYWREVF